MGFWGKSPKCNDHRIGNNNSKEVYVWKGREQTPYGIMWYLNVRVVADWLSNTTKMLRKDIRIYR
jgi:hypothetical protein